MLGAMSVGCEPPTASVDEVEAPVPSAAISSNTERALVMNEALYLRLQRRLFEELLVSALE